MPQVKSRQSHNKSKKGSTSSGNNNNAKSNVVTSSSSIDSTNDSLSQVTLEQENDLLKGIIEKGVYKSLAGSKQFERNCIVSKDGTGRTKVLVLNGSSMPMELSGKKINTPRQSLFPNKEKYDSTSFKGTQAQDDLPPQDHKLKGKDKLQDEIDSFEEPPQALVKWVPKTTSSSTSSSTTTTPRIPIKLMWVPKKKN